MTPDNSHNLKVALGCARANLPVFPNTTSKKRPLTDHGHHDATTDESLADLWLTQEGLAELLDISQRTLERMRTDGSGPVLYRRSDVEAWLQARSFTSTGEAKGRGV
jgi:hypothetical protein